MSNLNEHNEGPKQIVIPEQKFLSCSKCKYFERKLMKSGKHPHFRINCNHTDAQLPGLFCGNLTENTVGVVETPNWCPFLKNQSTVN